MKNAPAYPVASVDTALRLLLLFGDHDSVTVSECADILGVARSTAHRLLAMLVYRDFARQDPETRAYLPGTALVALGLTAVRDLDIRIVARPAMERLAGLAGETVNLVVQEGASVRFIDAVESPRALRVSGRIGAVRPAHCTSVGKALLADLPVAAVRRMYPEEALPTLTERSIATRAELESELKKVRSRGYAVNFGEGDPELSAVGVVLQGGPAELRTGLAIAVPTIRLPSKRIVELADALIATRDEILTDLSEG